MRSELGKECREVFRKMMISQFPEYREDKGQRVPPARYVWTWQHTSGIWFYIVLIVSQKDDRFTIDTGWNLKGELPPPSYCGGEDIIGKPQLFRTNYLWSGRDYWWPLVLRPEEYERVLLYKDDPIEQCLPLVAPAVWDAAEKLKEHVVPLFDKIIQSQKTSPVRDA